MNRDWRRLAGARSGRARDVMVGAWHGQVLIACGGRDTVLLTAAEARDLAGRLTELAEETT